LIPSGDGIVIFVGCADRRRNFARLNGNRSPDVAHVQPLDRDAFGFAATARQALLSKQAVHGFIYF